MIVADASVVGNFVGDDGRDGDLARARLYADGDAHVPQLLDVEVISVIRGRRLSGHLDASRAERAIVVLQQLSLMRYQHRGFIGRVWQLRDNLTPYDAAYVALAEALDCTLVTADDRLAGAPGIRCSVEVLRAE